MARTNGPARYSDGFQSLESGVDSGLSPLVIQPNQVAFAVNTTFRGGFPTQRPAFKLLDLCFESEAVQDDFEDGLWQGAAFYQADDNRNLLICSISGQQFAIDPNDNFSVKEISLAGDLNPDNLRYAWFCQAENYMVIQDGQSRPLIYNGSVMRRALDDEIKAGTCMAYANGRIWYASSNGLSYRATDLVGGPSGTGTNRYRDAVLKETENTYLNEGGDFAVPENSGGINAMVSPGAIDSSLGQGPLQVFTRNKVFSVNAPLDRTTWKDVQYPLVTVSQCNYGALSGRSAVPVNGDVFYRSADGVRSLILAQRQFGTWGNTPISFEMQRILRYDSLNLLRFSNAVLFDNRLLMTCAPHHVLDHGVYHSGLIVLDFDMISRMGTKSPPAWEGIWTGIRILQLVTGVWDDVERCFAFVLNTDKEIELWELSKSDWWDYDGTGRVIWSFETRSMFTQTPLVKKRLYTGDLFVDGIQGKVDFDVKYRPDQYPGWVDWHSWCECAAVRNCTLEDDCLQIVCLKPQYRPKMRLPLPADDCSATVDMLYRDFYTAQVRVQVTGPARITFGAFHAKQVPEPDFGECRECD